MRFIGGTMVNAAVRGTSVTNEERNTNATIHDSALLVGALLPLFRVAAFVAYSVTVKALRACIHVKVVLVFFLKKPDPCEILYKGSISYYGLEFCPMSSVLQTPCACFGRVCADHGEDFDPAGSTVRTHARRFDEVLPP